MSLLYNNLNRQKKHHRKFRQAVIVIKIGQIPDKPSLFQPKGRADPPIETFNSVQKIGEQNNETQPT